MKQQYLITDGNIIKDIELFSIDGIEIVNDKDSENNGVVSRKIQLLPNKDAYIVTYQIDSESKDAAKILSHIAGRFEEKYEAVVLLDDSSAYFNKRLFPVINEFERKLRKLLRLASVGVDLKEDHRRMFDELEKQEFGKLFDMLFTDDDFIRNIKETVNRRKFSRHELLDYIDSTDEATLWDSILNGKVNSLQNNFGTVRMARNDVMHAHNIRYKQYNAQMNLFARINKELDESISMIEIGSEMHQPTEILTNALSELAEKLEQIRPSQDQIENIGRVLLSMLSVSGKTLTSNMDSEAAFDVDSETMHT